jgi:integrase
LFTESYGSRGIGSIGAFDLEKFWNRPNWPDGKSTRRQAFSCIRTFFNWCERYDLIGKNPARRVTPPRPPDPLRNILLPSAMKEMLKTATVDQMAWLCLGGFAGLRSEEIVALVPADLEWRAKEIHVSDGKTGERYVKMEPAFVRHCPKKWALCERGQWYQRLKKLGLSRNVLRHSFATYHLARSKDANKTAHEMGHSDAKMVKRVYALAAKRADAAAWWGL